MLVRILYAEDERLTKVIMQNKLSQQEGFDIVWTVSVAETMQRLKESTDPANAVSPYDILVLDLGLKDSFGVSTFEQISQFYSMPTIVVTGIEDPDVAKKCTEMGAKYIFCKMDPTFDEDMLADKIVEVSLASKPMDVVKVKKRLAALRVSEIKTAKTFAGGYFTALGNVLLAAFVLFDAYHQISTTGNWVPTEWETAIFFASSGAYAIKKAQPTDNPRIGGK